MKQWQLSPQAPSEFGQELSDLSPLIKQLLYNRGLKQAEEIAAFLDDELDPALSLQIGEDRSSLFYSPFLFRDMEKAAEKIIDHIKAGDPIVVYGDYDADGVTASVVLLEALKILHAKAEVYLPDRVSEGYGLNKPAITQIAVQGFKLLITVDNGIVNKEEIAYAQSRGLEVIVTDHHVLPPVSNLPDCLRLDPADESEKYPWPYLAGVGVAFKLVSALLAKSSLSPKQKQLILEKSLDLVAVGTIADLVSLMGENRLLVKRGLNVLNQNKRLGLNELVKVAKISPGRPLEAWNVGWQIGPRLNAASRLGHANSAFALLTTIEPDEAKSLASELNQRNISRQEITEEISRQVESQIDPNNLPLVIIGVAGEDQFWNEGVIGLVAGRLAEKYYRPTLIITRLVEEAEFDPEAKKLIAKKVSFKGSGRSIEDFNLIEAVEEAAPFLEKHGGHPMACGFSISGEENLRLFREKIQSIAQAKLEAQKLTPKLKIEAKLEFSDINLKLVDEVNRLAPYGQNNPQPRFASYNLRLNDIVTMGYDNQHVKFRLSPADRHPVSFWAIAFGGASDYKDFKIGDNVDIAYYLDSNDFNGRREAQLKVVDLRHSEENI